MKRFVRVLMATSVAALVASAAWAGITGSHHDMAAWSGSAGTEVCYWCHGAPDLADYSTMTNDLGEVGVLCVTRCHGGSGVGAAYAGATTQPIPNIPATANELTDAYVLPDYSLDAIDFTLAHGNTGTDLLEPVNGGAVVTFDAIGQGFPYSANVDFECTTCHNVHENANTPFLQTALATGGPGGTSFCEACHTGRGVNTGDWMSAVGAPNGEHPVNITYDITSALDRSTTGGNRDSRTILIDNWGVGSNVFDVFTSNGAALNDPGTHYVTGGHMSDFNTANDTVNKVGCYTCHSAHMPSTATGTPANLVLRNGYDADGAGSPMCVSCHDDIVAGAVANLGADDPGSSGWYHPVGASVRTPVATNVVGNVATYTVTTTAFSIDVDLTNILSYNNTGNGLGNGGVGFKALAIGGGQPRCLSCHDIHGGVGYGAGTYDDGSYDSMAVADIDGTIDGSMTGLVCDFCHGGNAICDIADNEGNAGEVANVHHITCGGNDYSGDTYTDVDGDVLEMDPPSWGANMADGLQCSDCHVFNNTAHNW